MAEMSRWRQLVAEALAGASVALVAVGVGVLYGYPWGLITGGGMLWAENVLGAMLVMLRTRKAGAP